MNVPFRLVYFLKKKLPEEEKTVQILNIVQIVWYKYEDDVAVVGLKKFSHNCKLGLS
jgi:hypothetical protein